MSPNIPLLLTCRDRTPGARRHEPVWTGVPLPRGLSRDTDRWELVDEDGRPMPIQTEALDRWSDGSIRWLLVDTQASLAGERTQATVTLRPSTSPGDGSRVTVSADGDRWSIDTGRAVFALSHTQPVPLRGVLVNGGEVMAAGGHEFRLLASGGTPYAIQWEAFRVEQGGPLRARLATDGLATAAGRPTLRLRLQLEAYAGSAALGLRITLANPRRAAHPGGIWELGDAGSVLLREFTVAFGLRPDHAQTQWSVQPGEWHEAAGPVRVYQESSGGEHWNSRNHVNRDGIVPMQRRGYVADADGRRHEGLRATPILIRRGAACCGIGVPAFWQNFPYAVAIDDAAAEVSFIPTDFPDALELQGGEQKTYECNLLFGDDPVTARPLDWCRSRLVLHAAPQWHAQAQAVPFTVPAADEDPRFRALVDAAIDGPDTFAHKRERADEFGWRHFGDIYGDHEAVFHDGPQPLMSHYNNQYDALAGFQYQLMRTGDARWWSPADELARHVIDIDIYHTDADKSAYNHGLFWHTFHYVDAGKATHRTYPGGTIGGGPSCEQNYTTGLMLHYFATGDQASRAAAVELARFVVDIDDGGRTPFRWLDRGATGYATSSRSADYHGPGRGSGNSLNALLDGHRLTGDATYLQKAEAIVRRCTHPRQDVDALRLLDVENRWFYTMYLQSLAKYLAHKIERNELDVMYAYGRDVLLHFARWMAGHERPYLDHPEGLEYPTETWAAQDLRKSEIFDHAARFADGAERERFLERAAYFFERSVATLVTMPTRTLARPVVLLLVHGALRTHVRAHGVSAAPDGGEDWTVRWPTHRLFTTQRRRALRRARLAAIAAAVIAAVGAMWVGLRFLT